MQKAGVRLSRPLLLPRVSSSTEEAGQDIGRQPVASQETTTSCALVILTA